MALAEVWESLKHAIEAYTGLSPATFFTALALVAALYYVVDGFFGPRPSPQQERNLDEREAVEPLPPPVQLGEITEEELRVYDGSDPKMPLLMAIKGQIYDVTQSRMFYGPGGPYALFAGKDASRALAKMSFEQKDLTGDISDLGPFELEALQDWEYKFMSKYVTVGTVKKSIPVTEESDAGTSAVTEQTSHSTECTDHGAQSKDVTAENISTPTEDGVAGHHGDEVDQKAEVKENGSSGEGEEAAHNA